jgi:hypothetical protein
MNKEKEALLKTILAEPDIPHKVSERSIQRLLKRMKPQTEEMRAYLIGFYSAETRAQSRAFHAAFYAKFTPEKAKIFDEGYCQCLLNDLDIAEQMPKQFTNKILAPSL